MLAHYRIFCNPYPLSCPQTDGQRGPCPGSARPGLPALRPRTSPGRSPSFARSIARCGTSVVDTSRPDHLPHRPLLPCASPQGRWRPCRRRPCGLSWRVSLRETAPRTSEIHPPRTYRRRPAYLWETPCVPTGDIPCVPTGDGPRTCGRHSPRTCGRRPAYLRETPCVPTGDGPRTYGRHPAYLRETQNALILFFTDGYRFETLTETYTQTFTTTHHPVWVSGPRWRT
jgi:hypothetical protein